MKKILKQLPRRILQLSLTAISFVLVLAVVLQLALVLGVNMFSKGRAHQLVQDQVTAALADSGYDLTFASLYYDPVRGFTLYDIALSDTQGPIMTLDRFSLAVDLIKIPRRLLALEGHAGTLDLIRLPSGKEEPTKSEPLNAFALPDIFFRRLHIDLFRIETLNLAENIAGTALSLSPALKARIDLHRDIALDLILAPQADQNIQGFSLPERIVLRGKMNPQELLVTIEQALISAKDYKGHAAGTISLQPNGLLDLKLQAAYADMTTLTQGQIKSLDLHASVSGPLQAPALEADGTVVPASLKDKGLADIKLNITSKNAEDRINGLIKIATAYRDQPITLDADLTYDETLIRLNSLSGHAPEITLVGKGALNRADMMFDGSLHAEAKDLSHYKDLIGLALAGKAKLDVALSGKDNVQTASLGADAQDIQFNDIRLDQAHIETALADVRNPWPEKANIKASGLTLAPNMSISTLAATITDKGNGIYQLNVNGNGKLPEPLSFTAQTNITDITEPLPSLRDIVASVKSGQSTINLNGTLDKDKIDLTLAAKGFRSADIPAPLPDNQEPFSIDATVKMTGTPAAPVTAMDAAINGLAAGDYKGLSIKASAAHANPTATVNISGTGTGIRTLQAQASLPLQLTLHPFALTFNEAGLNGNFTTDLDIAPIAALFIPPTLKIAGDLNAQGTLSGAISAPVVAGTARVRNGSFADSANGITLHDLALEAALTQSDITLRSLTATDGEKGTLQGQGRIAFGDGGSTDLSISAKALHLPQSDLANGYLDAHIKLSNVTDGYAASGTIDITEMSILIPERFQSSIPALNIVERKTESERQKPLKIDLGIKINAHNQVFVRGWGLDAEFGGEVDITGDVSAPQFNGNLSSLRGRYEEFGKRFTLARADLRFQGSIPPSPYLDIEATIPADDVTASVLLSGSATAPSIKFAATPALPEDEVLSRILFGRSTARITPFQAIQLTQTIQRFSGKGGGGLNPLGLLRETTGLDDLTVDTDETGAASVGVGKYLTDKVYLELEKGKGPTSGAASIQIEVTPNINVESEVGQDARVGGGIFWKRDY